MSGEEMFPMNDLNDLNESEQPLIQLGQIRRTRSKKAMIAKYLSYLYNFVLFTVFMTGSIHVIIGLINQTKFNVESDNCYVIDKYTKRIDGSYQLYIKYESMQNNINYNVVDETGIWENNKDKLIEYANEHYPNGKTSDECYFKNNTATLYYGYNQTARTKIMKGFILLAFVVILCILGKD